MQVFIKLKKNDIEPVEEPKLHTFRLNSIDCSYVRQNPRPMYRVRANSKFVAKDNILSESSDK